VLNLLLHKIITYFFLSISVPVGGFEPQLQGVWV